MFLSELLLVICAKCNSLSLLLGFFKRVFLPVAFKISRHFSLFPLRQSNSSQYKSSNTSFLLASFMLIKAKLKLAN